MPFEMVVGLFVADRGIYSQYRAAIAPLLEEADAGFRYDFDVAKTLKSEGNVELNRVFVLRFPDRAARDRFFADPRYVSIRAALFDKAVERTVAIAEFDAPTTRPATTPPIEPR